jgi:hypothetical protein
MVRVLEFKNVDLLNDYLKDNVMISRFDIIPVSRLFENPNTKLITSCMTYVLIMNW